MSTRAPQIRQGTTSLPRSPSQPDTLTAKPVPSVDELDTSILKRRLDAVQGPRVAGYAVLRGLNAADCCNPHTSTLSQFGLTDTEERPCGSDLAS